MISISDESNRKIFISVVSHGHAAIIKELGSLEKLAKNYTIVIKNNISDSELTDYCAEHNIHLLDSEYSKGFGYNNNVVFNYCTTRLKMQDNDFFLVINPDIVVSSTNIDHLISSMDAKRIPVATINLYKDDGYTIFDDSVRNFPNVTDFFKSFVAGVNRTKLDKKLICEETSVDWCAGSFMAFTVHAFKQVKGFDVNYFMYCEDVDICFRLHRKKIDLVYFPNVKAVHKARHNNRELFSRHFWWHLKSVGLFLLAKNGFLKSKSNLLG